MRRGHIICISIEQYLKNIFVAYGRAPEPAAVCRTVPQSSCKLDTLLIFNCTLAGCRMNEIERPKYHISDVLRCRL